MNRLIALILATAAVAAARDARACGAAIQLKPGYPGTALAEGVDQLSIFTGSENGYSWDRLQLSTHQRTHVCDVPGVLQGNVETDARVDRAIAAQNGQVVEVSSAGVTQVSVDPEAATTTFGAALDPQGLWWVVTYRPDEHRLALFQELSAGTFTRVGALDADCDKPEMLDAVVEPDGQFVGLCFGSAVLVRDGALTLATLPLTASALTRATNGDAVFYSVQDAAVVRMSRSGSSWAQDAQIPTSSTGSRKTRWIIPISEKSFIAKSDDGFVAHNFNPAGYWESSAVLDPPDDVLSAFGNPAQVLSGDYELTLSTYDYSWTTTDLGPIGVEPVYDHSSHGGGCVAAGGAELLPLFLTFGLAWMRRRRA